jgi:hypothetical protein
MLALDERSGIVPHPAGAADAADAMVALRRAEVHQATGMVAAQLGVGVPDALVALRARAYVTGQRLSEVASEVLARRLRFAAPAREVPAGEVEE